MSATKAPYAKLKQELDAAFSAAMESMSSGGGIQVQQFAQSLASYFQVPKAIPYSNGVGALKSALQLLRLPKGAEVVVPAFGDATMMEVLLQFGLEPVFADVDPNTFTVNVATVKNVVSSQTAAILATHLFGQCAPLQELMEFSEKSKLWLIEDASQAFGAKYTAPNGQALKAGSLGHLALLNFFPVKATLDSGEGSAVLVNDGKLVEQLESLIKNSSETAADLFAEYKLDTLQAAMLDVKMKYAEAFIREREEVARFYDAAFAETDLIQTPFRALYSSHVYQQYTIQMRPALRDGLQIYLRDNYIPSAVYYPRPLPLQYEFLKTKAKAGDCPVSEHLCSSVLSLPMHTELKQEQLEYICQHVLSYVKRHS